MSFTRILKAHRHLEHWRLVLVLALITTIAFPNRSKHQIPFSSAPPSLVSVQNNRITQVVEAHLSWDANRIFLIAIALPKSRENMRHVGFDHDRRFGLAVHSAARILLAGFAFNDLRQPCRLFDRHAILISVSPRNDHWSRAYHRSARPDRR